MTPRLTLACADYDRVRPLRDGRVRAEGLDVEVVTLPARETFDRMLSGAEFDAAEMFLAPYAAMRARGRCPFVGLPVFLSRAFRHDVLFVNAGAGIETPADLTGRRVGLLRYDSTTAVFLRGMLQHDHGVTPGDVHWFWGSQDDGDHGPERLVAPALPQDVRLERIPSGATLSGMLEEGALDALFAIRLPGPFLHGSPRVRRLFPDPARAALDYYRRTGIFPIMHLVVLRADVHRERPWVAASLFRALTEAKDLAIRDLYDTDALRVTLPFLIDHLEATVGALGADFWPYGVEPSRRTLEALAAYLLEQGLAPRRVEVEELFAPETLSG